MERNSMYFDTNAIKINKDDFRPGFRITRFFRCLWFVILNGESPLATRKSLRKHYRY
ncbi:hypothetical protein KJS94_13870 [Flavihumibacter rivuli]|uniref:hypothetical protein n=1 Tax=Flavihumibacter rivuli TaxID=2838156 RepID=UPI001BDDE1D9|nr:hypothetical protein [Flavihumibacter rivuli]ULQ55731.1 hypothetical protein KJS94_13870 [Flavihumibacter rivuli]